MHNHRFIPALVVAGSLSLQVSAAGADPAHWPQFRGPNASGVATDARPPATFGPGDHERWKVAVPWSPSSPIVWGDRIYLTTFDGGELETRAHDRASGRLLWKKGIRPEKLEVYHRTDGSPAASTPATDGRRVVSYFGSFGLVCHDVDGKELWRHPLPVAISGGSYGSGTSPVIHGRAVLLNRDQDLGSSLLALDVETGRKLWETPRPGANGSFGTPVIWRNGDTDEVVHPGSIELKGYDLSTGAERWRLPGVSVLACTTPVVADGMLFFGAWAPGKLDTSFPTDWESFSKFMDQNKDGKVDVADVGPVQWDYLRGIDSDRNGAVTPSDLEQLRAAAAKAENVLVGIRPGGKGDISSSHVAWKFTRGLPYVPSPVHYDGRIYMVKDGGLMSSVDARTGKAFYSQERIGAAGSHYASPVVADGRVIVASVNGRMSIVKAGGEKPEVMHAVEFGERILATPALAGNAVYVRTDKHLYAFDSAVR